MVNEFFEEPSSKSGKKPKSSIKKKSKKIAAALVIIVLFIGIAAVSAGWALKALVHTRHEVSVPDIKGKMPAEALNLMAASNLAIKKVAEEPSTSIPPAR
ncbi:hypothetical protein Dip510_001712 [Elusimicrobium posterum]|uniref:hypothetical protein n=1 Tax=Elusimicrobium posterum TaxID=3116653 RepID=UPI003C78D3C8